jgi:anti-sigma regulatory factor (Ser/Thr protein kinase)
MDETARLAALERYRILDTAPEMGFDDLTHLASQICGTPVALITLVDADRQWFKSRLGISVAETSRSVSFCAHAIQTPGNTYIVPDTLEHDIFRENPFVTNEPKLRFYAGAPLVTPDGYPLGTLCVADRVPRKLTPDQLAALEALAHQAEAQLELRVRVLDLERAHADQERLIVELRNALSQVQRLSALMPYCSACELNMIIPADPAAIPKVTDGVTHMLTEKGWSEQKIMEVELALQEAIANAVRHGCRNDPTRQLQCVVTVDDAGEMMVVVRDPGPGFDTTAVANPLDPENVLKPSGRGIFLINQLMDTVAFADGGREVQMRKKKETSP